MTLWFKKNKNGYLNIAALGYCNIVFVLCQIVYDLNYSDNYCRPVTMLVWPYVSNFLVWCLDFYAGWQFILFNWWSGRRWAIFLVFCLDFYAGWQFILFYLMIWPQVSNFEAASNVQSWISVFIPECGMSTRGR